MGWRCPLCNADFGHNKDEFNEHIANCQNGMAGAFVKAVIETCEKKECEPPCGDKEDCEFNHNGLCY